MPLGYKHTHTVRQRPYHSSYLVYVLPSRKIHAVPQLNLRVVGHSIFQGASTWFLTNVMTKQTDTNWWKHCTVRATPLCSSGWQKTYVYPSHASRFNLCLDPSRHQALIPTTSMWRPFQGYQDLTKHVTVLCGSSEGTIFVDSIKPTLLPPEQSYYPPSTAPNEPPPIFYHDPRDYKTSSILDIPTNPKQSPGEIHIPAELSMQLLVGSGQRHALVTPKWKNFSLSR